MNEKSVWLSEHLAALNEGLLARALATDDAEKLRALKKPFYKRSAFLRACAVAAACVILTVTLGMGLSLWRGGDTAAPPWELDMSETRVESLDALNYYAAIELLAKTQDKTDIGFYEGARRDALTVLPDGGTKEEVYTYELDPDEVFTVSEAIFFRIEITNEKSFLASRLGCGTADAVITQNSLEPMITFKSGERYFSCLANGETDGVREFTTHKYIDGFAIVKNFEQENHAFRVSMNGTRVTGLTASSTDGSMRYENDAPKTVGKSYAASGSVGFTVRQLSEHFAGITPPMEGAERIYTGASYSLVLHEDGGFIMRASEGAHTRAGRYERTDKVLTLHFLSEGEIVEEAVCDLTVTAEYECFYYDGELYTFIKEQAK